MSANSDRPSDSVETTNTRANHDRIMAIPAMPQPQSPLLSLPAEIRLPIFEYALTSYLDENYDKEARMADKKAKSLLYVLVASKRTDAQLLRTCRAVYTECWYMPVVLCKDVYVLANGFESSVPYSPMDKPPSWHARQAMVELAAEHQAKARSSAEPAMEIECMHVLSCVEEMLQGKMLEFLRRPRLTVSRTLHISLTGALDNPAVLLKHDDWLKAASLPTSVREVHLEIFTCALKLPGFRKVADRIIDKWFFARCDGAVLYGDTKVEHDWPSWILDCPDPENNVENDVEPLSMTIIFRTEATVLARGGSISEKARANARIRGGAHGFGPEWTPTPVDYDICRSQ